MWTYPESASTVRNQRWPSFFQMPLTSSLEEMQTSWQAKITLFQFFPVRMSEPALSANRQRGPHSSDHIHHTWRCGSFCFFLKQALLGAVIVPPVHTGHIGKPLKSKFNVSDGGVGDFSRSVRVSQIMLGSSKVFLVQNSSTLITLTVINISAEGGILFKMN